MSSLHWLFFLPSDFCAGYPVRSIQTIKAGSQAQKHYYTQDATILPDTDPDAVETAEWELTHAQWVGRDAARLGLTGDAQQADVEQIFDGYIPGTNARIRQERPRSDQQENCVYDLVLTCKKSVSLQIHLGEDARVFRAALAAAREVVTLIEQDYAWVRIQRAGVRQIVPTGGMICLLLPHHTTRAGDPGVHFHLLIANGSFCPDGQWRALLDRGFSHAYFLGDKFATEWQFQNGAGPPCDISLNLSQREIQFCQEQATAWLDELTQPLRVEDYIADALRDYQAQVQRVRQALQDSAERPVTPLLWQHLQAMPNLQASNITPSPPPFWQPSEAEKPEGMTAAHWEEFQRSAIHPDLVSLNAESLAGDAVLERLLSHRLAEMASGIHASPKLGSAC
jgi:hypothetical protein